MRNRLILILSLLLSVPVLAGSSQPFASIQQLQDKHDGELHGFCTAWKERQTGLWVTAAHCYVAEDLYIGGKPAHVIGGSKEYDVMLLEGGPSAPGLNIGFGNTPDAGTVIYTAGYPAGATVPIYSQGVVANADFTGPFAAYNLTAGPGSSGGPVMVKGNVVVGVLQFVPCVDPRTDRAAICPYSGGVQLQYLRHIVLDAR